MVVKAKGNSKHSEQNNSSRQETGRRWAGRQGSDLGEHWGHVDKKLLQFENIWLYSVLAENQHMVLRTPLCINSAFIKKKKINNKQVSYFSYFD